MAQDSSDNQNIETVVSGYRLLRGLGRGNTSRVYLAEKIELAEPDTVAVVRAGTRVALKLPLPGTLADQAAAERFANEVRLTLQFRHPHLVVGLDGTPFGPGTFLALHHYPGDTLARQLRAVPLTLNATLQVLADVASGLAYLHHAGAVHQDVKTQNVYLEDGETPGLFRAALGDFGSTYFQAQGGQVSGSPFYMAPEVYQGEMTGPPSDVYSFGVMAHELLTGERPHLGESYESLMVSHLTRFPTPLNIEGLPRPLARLLDSALAKRPADRPGAATLRRTLLQSLGQADETGEAVQEQAPAPAVNRASVGRHGPDSAPVRPATFPQSSQSGGPQGGGRSGDPSPGPPEKRGWNPFKKKK
ncbi:serine/threonine-protein kinase [Deinococcus sp.]|uniref:serine/threonine-protein kinase n=1 Tax=Deinococcus sp. TaxID=47478 RepID=UPI003C7D3DD1